MKESHAHYVKEKLDQIEIRLQTLVEGASSQALSKSHFRQNLAHDLVRMMRLHLATLPDGRISAPCQYIIHINPSHGKSWIPEQFLLDELSEAIDQAGNDAGIYFASTPDLRLVADYDLPIDEFSIEIPAAVQVTGKTSSLKLPQLQLNPKEEPISSHPPDAFLIIHSSENIQLKQSVINLGRSPDNHIIIDDPRVSRAHAQLRFVKGRHFLFDLNSKGGTFINGKKISQSFLNSGDVISLAGVPLIYVIDTPPELSNTDALVLNPPDNPKRIIK